jgi:hypothetical protein
MIEEEEYHRRRAKKEKEKKNSQDDIKGNVKDEFKKCFKVEKNNKNE